MNGRGQPKLLDDGAGADTVTVVSRRESSSTSHETWEARNIFEQRGVAVAVTKADEACQS